MKNKSLIFSTLFVFTVITVTLFFNSCTKEENVNPQTKSSIDDELGQYTKKVTIFDAKKENSAVLLVGSNDESILNMWSSDNFELVPIKIGQSFSEAIKDYYELNPINEDNDDGLIEDEVELQDNVDEPSVNTVIIEKKLNEGVRNIAVTVITPDFGDNRGWSTQHHYSYNQETRCEVERTSWLHKVYYGLFYKKYSSSSWTEIKGFPTKLSNNDPKSYHYDPCYKYDLKVKARRSKHYTYSFDE